MLIERVALSRTTVRPCVRAHSLLPTSFLPIHAHFTNPTTMQSARTSITEAVSSAVAASSNEAISLFERIFGTASQQTTDIDMPVDEETSGSKVPYCVIA